MIKNWKLSQRTGKTLNQYYGKAQRLKRIRWIYLQWKGILTEHVK
jgi:hypothetical protein